MIHWPTGDLKRECVECKRVIYVSALGKLCLPCKAKKKADLQKRRYQAKKEAKQNGIQS